MSDKIPDGGPAFPVNSPNGDHPGMSLRDWFAGQALAALAANVNTKTEDDAFLAYQLADDMLQQREAK